MSNAPDRDREEMRRFLVDTDTAADDPVALVMALRHPDVRLEAVTVVAGNVPVDQGVQNALYTLELLGEHVPVFRGAEAPLLAPLRTSQFIHGEDGMGDIGLPLRGREPHPGHAVDALLEAVGRHPGEVELVTLGPLTNVAMALHKDPSFAGKVKECVMMGGASDHLGNMTPVAEFNVWVDPEAAKEVFSSGMPLKMVGLDVSRKHAVFTPEESAKLRDVGTPPAEFCVDIQKVVHTEWDGGFELPDAIAMAVALDPAVATRTARRFVAVETGGEWSRGQTVVDHHEITIMGEHEPNVEVVEEASRERFLELLYEAIRP
jgi:purine nucleosidase